MPIGRGKHSSATLGWSQSLLFALGATCASIAATLGREMGWLSGLILALLGSAAILFVFVATRERSSTAPLFPVSVWRSRIFWSFWGLLFLCAMALGSTFFLVPFYLHDAIGLPVHVAAGWMIVQARELLLAAMTAARMQGRA